MNMYFIYIFYLCEFRAIMNIPVSLVDMCTHLWIFIKE